MILKLNIQDMNGVFHKLLLITLIIGSCKSVNPQKEFIDSLLSKEASRHFCLDSIRGIFIVSESGCRACNQGFIDFSAEIAKSDSSILVYIGASGVICDISTLNKDSIPGLIMGRPAELIKHGFTEGSYFVGMNQGTIDSILLVNAQNIFEATDYIGKLLLKP